MLPVLLDDLNGRMRDWGTKGKINPFKEVYDVRPILFPHQPLPDSNTYDIQLVFQMTVRIAACRELAEDKQAIQDIRKYFFDVEQSTTPVSVFLPWFPGPAKRVRTIATYGIYFLIKKYVTMRREAKIPSSDPIDFLIANGDPDEVIVSVSALNLLYGYS